MRHDRAPHALTGALVALILTGTAPALATTCIDYRPFPQVAGHADLGSRGKAVALSGNLAFVAADPSGLRIVDITDPHDPLVVGAVDTPGRARDVALSDALTHVYIADSDSGLHIIDVTSAGNPVIVGSIDTPGSATDLAVKGALIFVAGTSGLQIVDAGDPTDPAIVGELPTTSSVRSIVVGDDFAYLSNGAELQVVDIADPAGPTVVASAPVSGSLALAGDHVCVVSYSPPLDSQRMTQAVNGFWMVDVSNPLDPTVVGSGNQSGVDVTVVGQLAIVGAYDWNVGYGIIRLVDISDPTTPTTRARCYTWRSLAGVAAGDRVICGTDWNGLQVVVAEDLDIPYPTGIIDTERANDLAVRGSHAFIADGVQGVLVVDVTEPANPTQVGSVDTGGSVSVAVDGDMIYAESPYDLYLIDVSDPTTPFTTATLPITHLGRVAARDDHVYAIGFQAVHVIDARNPASPYIVQTLPFGWPTDVRIAGDHLYVTDFHGEFFVFDLFDPADPVLVGSTSVSPHGAQELTLDGSHAYVADVNTGFAIIDISDPTAPAVLARVTPPPPGPYGIAASGNTLYAGAFAQILVYDITDRTSPLMIGAAYPPGLVDLEVADDLIYVAGYGYGMVVLPVQCDASVDIPEASPLVSGIRLRAAPNPGRGSITISFDAPSPQKATIEIFDVAGRMVRRIVSSGTASGPRVVAWDGRTETGSAVPSGVYTIRMRDIGGEHASERVILIR